MGFFNLINVKQKEEKKVTFFTVSLEQVLRSVQSPGQAWSETLLNKVGPGRRRARALTGSGARDMEQGT